MNRGDIWQLDLGGRAGKRPALILTRPPQHQQVSLTRHE